MDSCHRISIQSIYDDPACCQFVNADVNFSNFCNCNLMKLIFTNFQLLYFPAILYLVDSTY